jgi:catechol 2,3-dioxygenase-like lactoylglutathione lyase family enzyme
MIQAIEKMLLDFERGHLSRRQFALSLAALTTSACASRALATSEPTGFRAVSLNHVTVRVPDLHRTSQFYQEFFGMPLKQHSSTVHILGVGDSFFGIEQGENKTATVDHYDFGIAHFNADEIRAKLQERGLKFLDPKAQESFKFFDPDGFQVQVNAPGYVGHVS